MMTSAVVFDWRSDLEVHPAFWQTLTCMRPLHEAHAGSVPHLPASYLHLSMSLVTCLIAVMENSSDQAGIVDSADNILSIMITY